MNWSAPTSFSEMTRRAGGRRQYNALRLDLKLFRRHDVAELLLRFGCKRGVQVRIAQALGVSESVVSRDVNSMLQKQHICPSCGCYKPREIDFATREQINAVLERQAVPAS